MIWYNTNENKIKKKLREKLSNTSEIFVNRRSKLSSVHLNFGNDNLSEIHSHLKFNKLKVWYSTCIISDFLFVVLAQYHLIATNRIKRLWSSLQLSSSSLSKVNSCVVISVAFNKITVTYFLLWLRGCEDLKLNVPYFKKNLIFLLKACQQRKYSCEAKMMYVGKEFSCENLMCIEFRI